MPHRQTSPPKVHRACHVKKGDEVVVISGSERGKRGRIRRVLHEKDRAIVEGLQQVKKHKKRSQTLPHGAIVDQDGSIHISNLMLADRYDARRGHTPAATPAGPTSGPEGEKKG